ncbi:PAS domain S-box-containing protein [Haloarchaeobius iranensis]|uniref:histidine kinase n=2 Tax=Haloarchaeobius iranensis TaxID=996166 RepID=A0A1G9SJS1_9EURY|nr:PAS domain S-box-containing protein [Haloarchaeobius iranensis]
MAGVRVAVLATDEEHALAVATAIGGEWTVDARTAAEELEHDPTCLVVATDPTTADDLRAAAVAVDAPAVVFADGDPTAIGELAAFDGFVRDDGTDGAATRLADEVAWHVASGDDYPTALRERTAKVTRLHRVATELVGCESETAVYESAVRAAEEILDLDLVGIDVVEDGYFVPVAVSGGMEKTGYAGAGEIAVDEGIAGETYQSGASIVVDDVRERENEAVDKSDPGYRSVLSVPVGDFGILQAGSPEPDAFDDRDRELVELLVTHVAETVERLRAEGHLRRQRDRLSALFENVPDPVVRFALVDGELRVQEVNPAFESTFGWSTAEVIDEDIDEYIVPEGFEDEARSLNQKLLAGESLQVVSRRKTEDEVRDFLLHVVPFERGERSLQGFAIYTDITEEKQRQRELERQNERLDAFASIVSHDLRNPLSIAQGYVGLAEETGDPEHFDEIRRAHGRMNTLIDDLLALARQGNVVGDTEPVDLGPVATQAWSSVRTGDATLSVVDSATVDADRDRLVELLENLFRNAVTHGTGEEDDPADTEGPSGRRPDGEPLRVTVGPLADRHGFSVDDDGIGYDGDDPSRILESGFTTSEVGTGFGLTIVREIAEAHGWSVDVVDDDGLRFEFVVE